MSDWSGMGKESKRGLVRMGMWSGLDEEKSALYWGAGSSVGKERSIVDGGVDLACVKRGLCLASAKRVMILMASNCGVGEKSCVDGALVRRGKREV
jgi:hypothetical protein